MAGELNLKMVIDGSSKGAIAALVQLSTESKKAGGDLSRLDLAVGNMDKTRAGVAEAIAALKPLSAESKKVGSDLSRIDSAVGNMEKTRGSVKGAVAALAPLSAESKKASWDLSRLDLAAGNMDKTRGSVAALTKDMRGLQGSILGFAGAAGVSLTVAGVVQLADAYSQMTGRLRLATQYSGDFAEVQSMLQQSARDTRSDLVGTVDLYTKMSNVLKGVGMTASDVVGIITAINQAIGLSGVSAQAASASLVQLAQGFGSGVLRGEELNSVMEQTPALAMAIADGLGLPIGELRKLGEEGKLTAEAVAGALQKMAPQLEADFAKMPVTVSQALTGLRNEILLYVGVTDTAVGGTSALAGVIASVAQEFKEAGPIVTAFSTGIKTLADGLDGSYRLLKIMGLGLAGYGAAAKAALTGNFSEAKTILAAMGEDVAAVLEKPLASAPKIINAAVDGARKRALLEAQLSAQTERLAQLREYVEGKASDNVAAKDKSNADARIADQKRVVDAVRAAWQASLQDAEKFAEAAKAKLTKATDFRSAGQSAAFNAQISGLSPEEQTAAKQQRLSDLQSQGSYEAARARMAAIEGDAKKYEATAGAAEKKLKEALQLAEDVKDVTAIESISEQLAKVQESGAALDNKKAEEANARAADQAKTLNALQAQLDAMTKEARKIEVDADVTKADSQIKGLKAQLDDLAKGTVVPVTVATNGAPAAAAPAEPDPIVGRAYGGILPGFAPHDRADNMTYRGTPGEFLVQRPTVKQRGARAFLYDFNTRGMAALADWQVPRYAFGGEIGGSVISRLSVPSVDSTRASRAASGKNLTLVLDDQRYSVGAGDDVIDRLSKHVALQQRKRGGRG